MTTKTKELGDSDAYIAEQLADPKRPKGAAPWEARHMPQGRTVDGRKGVPEAASRFVHPGVHQTATGHIIPDEPGAVANTQPRPKWETNKQFADWLEAEAKEAPNVPPEDAEKCTIEWGPTKLAVGYCRAVLECLAKRARKMPSVKSKAKPMPDAHH